MYLCLYHNDILFLQCPYEWYHCECVGITDPPKGKWYCPQCITTMKSRRSRKTT